MKAAKTTARPSPRVAGAQHAKAMLLAIYEKDEAVAAASELAETATPQQIGPIVDAHLGAVLPSANADFRAGFCAALGEWLAPTTQGSTIGGGVASWQPLAEEGDAAKHPPAPDIWKLLDPADTALDRAIRLSELAKWIEKARCLTEVVAQAVQYDEALRGHLKRADIAYNDAEWAEENSVGLVYLHSAIQADMRAAREVVDDAMDAAHSGKSS